MDGRLGLQGVLFDLDGVLYDGHEPIAGACETVAWTGAQGIPHLFLTNTTSRPRSALVEKLAGFGIQADLSQILTPPAAAVAWLRKRPAGALALFLPPAAQADFRRFAIVPEDEERGASYVVIGDLGEAWDYRKLNRAFRLLHHDPKATLIALGMSRFWKTPDGVSLDVAPFVVALEHATGRRAVVLGKPAELFFHAATDQLGLPADQVLMIGDDLRSDIGGAQAAGLKAALVRTGKFRPADLDSEIRPEVVLNSVADLPRWWKSS